jgi:hypothetical protein
VTIGVARGALTAFVALWALLGLVSPVVAQEIDKGAVQELAEEVQGKDPQQVFQGLKSGFESDDLPDGFTEPTYIGLDATPEAGETVPVPGLTMPQFEGVVGFVPFMVTAEGDGAATVPAEEWFPSGFFVISFLVCDDEEVAATMLEQVGGADSGVEFEEHEAFGVPGVAGGAASSEEGLNTATAQNAVQVGNVVISVYANQYVGTDDEPDVTAAERSAKELVAVGIDHLGEVVDDL